MQLSGCISPFVKDTGVNGKIAFPCGKCPICAKRQATGWSFRLMQELKISASAYFITMTYDTSHIPITEKGYKTLHKPDLIAFHKALRKLNPLKLKYYQVGEYGTKTQRPHYHIILFNAKIDTIQKAWFKGSIHYGQVNEATVGYTLKYIQKKSSIIHHKNDDRQPQFASMSKGIGIAYTQRKEIINYHNNDPINRTCMTIQDGVKVSMPRYYKDKIFTEINRKKIAIFYKRQCEEEALKLTQDPNWDTINRNRNQAILSAFILQEKNSIKHEQI